MTPQPPPPTDALTTSSAAYDKLSAPGPLVLHIGAGRRKIVGAVTLDINPALEPDVVWDLNQFP